MKNFKNKNLKSSIKKAGLLVFLLFLVLILSGCSIKDFLSVWDKKIGETFNNFQEKEKNSIIELMEQKNQDKKPEPEKEDSDEFTLEQKTQIDEWLAKKGLNRYGDSKNAMYAGGTPLFNEETGEAIDRYDYLLNKFPDLLERIKE